MGVGHGQWRFEIATRTRPINDQYGNYDRKGEQMHIDQAKAPTQFGPELNEKQLSNLKTDDQRTV